MKWILENARGSFDGRAGDWDSLNERLGGHVLLDSRFVGSLVRHFASDGVLLARSPDERIPGMALVVERRRGIWETYQPSQAPLGLVLLPGPERPGRRIRSLLASLPGHALSLSVLQQDPDAASGGDLRDEPGVEILDYIQTARLTKRGDFDAFWAGRSKNLTHNLTRQRRRLGERSSSIGLSVHRSVEDVAACVAEYGRLESAGWKAGTGTAVAADNAQGRFYREVLETFCRRGEGVIYRLLLDGETIACDLCLLRAGTLIVLKTAYDERRAGLSPGLLLHQDVFRDVFHDEALRRVEFYGRVRDWHLKWTDEVRTLYHATCDRHPWLLPIRRLLKSLRTVRGAETP